MTSAPGAAAVSPLRSPAARALAVIVALLTLNPLTYALGQAAGGLQPDSIAYLAFSQELLRHGHLVLSGWGHADSGLILPPAYPALVGAWSSVTGDAMAAAHAVSSAALLLALVPLALIAIRLCGALGGFLAVAVALAHPFFLRFGTVAMTEGLFVLVLAIAALGALTLPVARALWPSLLLGAAAALLFLARSIGGFLWPALIVVATLLTLHARPAAPLRAIAARAALVTAGFALVLAPYAIAVHAQSGHWPVTQAFRLNQYVVRADAAAPPAGAAMADDYEAIYAQRRQQRRLTPDSAEMLGALVAPAAAAPGLPVRVAAIARNAVSNVGHLRQALGLPALLLLGLALLTPLWRSAGAAADRWVLPVLLVSYVGAVSLVAGAIPRYVEVLVPFAWIQIFAEALRLAAPLLDRLPRPALGRAAAGGLLAALCIATLPQTFRSVALGPRIGERGNPLTPCRAQLTPGAPVFAFHPMGVYLLGGTFRVVPNDALDKVSAYGEKTGVHHLLLTRLRADLAERAYYDHALWARDERGLADSGRVEPVCRTEDGVATLYRLRG